VSRNLITPNDFGPKAVPRSRLTRNGLGARLILSDQPWYNRGIGGEYEISKTFVHYLCGFHGA
jgi:hypothetical protein